MLQMPHILEIIGLGIFAIALAHTFLAKSFEHLAHLYPRHAGVFHLLGEVEVVFGFWAMVLAVLMFFVIGQHETLTYLETRNFTEPMFVFAIMVVAGTRPILTGARTLIDLVADRIPANPTLVRYVLILSIVPLCGSLMTEPAAMTLAALMLRDFVFAGELSSRMKYATLGVLFVNVSIGGCLTNFAAPPVLMVAGKWDWSSWFMLSTFGWKAALAVLVNSIGVTMIFRSELVGVKAKAGATAGRMPVSVVLTHLAFLVSIVAFSHHPVVFISLLLFFLGFATAYARHQDRLILREGLLVAFFLAGLVVLGGMQQWWLQPLLTSLDADTVYFGATALTAITDNAALTYLGSLVEGLTPEFKEALVAGAVTGGGLTVIANAPNPAGAAILKDKFSEGSISALGLLAGATMPTLVAILAFRLL